MKTKSPHTFLSEGDDFYQQALKAIAGARKHILFNMYIFRDDFIGKTFQQALIKKAQQGITVWLIYDRVGSIRTAGSFWQQMISAGVRVYPYRPSPFRLRTYKRLNQSAGPLSYKILLLFYSWLKLFFYRRNHRKVIVIDHQIAFAGGFNIMKECSREQVGEKRWLDLMYVTDQPVMVREISRFFYDALRRLRFFDLTLKSYYRKRTKEAICVSSEKPWHYFKKWKKKRYIKRYRISKIFKKLLIGSKERIWLMFPYFIPYQGYVRILKKKARQGKDVRVFLSLFSDRTSINDLSYFMAANLQKAGVKVYLYHGQEEVKAPLRFNHSKTCLIDDWLAIGSSNIDSRSLLLNLENMVFLKQAEIVSKGESFFNQVKGLSYLADATMLKSGLRAKLLFFFKRFL